MSERTYRFGEDTINADEAIKVEDVQAAWSQVHPALENAEAIMMEDGSYDFRVRAGTKGAERTYRFGEDIINADEAIKVEDVQAAWSQVHPALENAEAIMMEDGSYDFRVRAGTKG
jgi:uncharacterized protein YhdP